MSSPDGKAVIDALQGTASYKADPRAAIVFLASTAERAERYEDMCKYVYALVNWVASNDTDLSVEERNLFSVAYKNVVGARRASWRTLQSDEGKFDDLLADYRKRIEAELSATCKEVLSLLEDKLLKGSVRSADASVFYLKMAGDYYRYLAEFTPSEEGYDKKSAHFYGQAFDIAKEKLEPTDPVRLGLALNYSVCYYEILKDKKKACELAKSAFDAAISKLDTLGDDSYKDSTLIMQLLRDNLTLWQSAEQSNVVEDVEDD